MRVNAKIRTYFFFNLLVANERYIYIAYPLRADSVIKPDYNYIHECIIMVLCVHDMSHPSSAQQNTLLAICVQVGVTNIPID